MGVVKTESDWLAVEPTAFRCATGQSQTVRATTQKLKTGDYRQTVHIISNAGDAGLPAHIQVIFSLEPETIVIPAGPFTRGSKGREPEDILATPTGTGDDLLSRMFRSEPKPNAKAIPPAEQPQREINLTAYAIGRYPVTNAEYAVFIANTNRRSPAHWIDGHMPPGLDNHPVVNVTWSDAATYCLWLSEVTGKTYRLPTEAQWEKAARGTDRRPFPWGGRWDKHRCNTLETGLRSTTPIGLFSPGGDSPYDCADMAGNVWEWVLDWFSKDYYANSTVVENPLGPVNGAVKVMRGGSFNVDGWQARTSNRSYANRNLASAEVGFRVTLAL
jgi:formylglycine-generating enzyme required for sulfatase activity